VQRLELALGVPPAMGEVTEFLELEWIDVRHAGFSSRDSDRRIELSGSKIQKATD
jgi:hypothetical protein